MKKESTKIKNSNIKKRSIYTIVFAVVFIAAIIFVNVFAVSLAQKLPTTLDLTTESSNTLTGENIDYIKSVDLPIEIIVCATREGYTGSEMVNYAYSVYSVNENDTKDNYFNITINLLESYAKYNDKISVSYIDPQTPEFRNLESEYDVEIAYGDIIVRCTRPDENKKDKKFETVITFNDIYELYDAASASGGAMYGYSSYTITATNIETNLSSAIYTVASSDKKKVGLLSAHSTKDADVAFTTALAEYNYELLDIDGIINADSIKDMDTLLLVAPKTDLTAAELTAIDKFLDNDGKKGKNFLVFASTVSPATPNLNEFLEEWGIRVKNGMAYDTNAGYRLGDGVSMMLFNKGNKLTSGINSAEKLYYCGDIVSTEVAYETAGTRTTNLLMTTSSYAVTAPKGSNGYTPSSEDVKGEMPLAIATKDVAYDSNYDEVTSYVGFFASTDFINEAWEQFGDNGNMDFAISVTNVLSGRDISSMYFLPKITDLTNLDSAFTDAEYTAVYIIFIVVIPALFLIGGGLVWFRRRNR